MTKRERQYKHVLENLLDSGKPLKVAERIAASVVNKTRRRFARKGRGPKLIKHGGSRRQWYPGKPHKGPWRCLSHRKRFKSKAGWLSHMRSHRRKAGKRRY
jgi:hypothetical protein